MYLKWVTNSLLILMLIYLLHTDAESIRAVIGETVHLPCHSLPDDSVEGFVKWKINNTAICEWKFNNKSGAPTGECIPRFTFNGTSFALSVKNVQFSDSGNYSCKTTRIIKPPTLDNISNVILQVEGLSLHLQNSSNDACVHLICSLESLTPKLVNFTWTREGHGSLHPSSSSAVNSELHLCKPDWSDGDTIICHASYSNSQIQRRIKLPSQNATDNVQSSELSLMWILICSGAAGLIICIILVVVCTCRKRDENGSIVFTNKVYENFSFAMARQNTQSLPKPEPEECIYEN